MDLGPVQRNNHENRVRTQMLIFDWKTNAVCLAAVRGRHRTKAFRACSFLMAKPDSSYADLIGNIAKKSNTPLPRGFIPTDWSVDYGPIFMCETKVRHRDAQRVARLQRRP